MFKLTESRIWYGTRSIPYAVSNADAIPPVISSADDLDLEKIAAELNRTVFDRSGRRNRSLRRGRTDAQIWGLEVRVTDKAKCDRVRAAFEEAGVPVGELTEQVYVAGNGISFRYEKEA